MRDFNTPLLAARRFDAAKRLLLDVPFNDRHLVLKQRIVDYLLRTSFEFRNVTLFVAHERLHRDSAPR